MPLGMHWVNAVVVAYSDAACRIIAGMLSNARAPRSAATPSG